MAKSEKKIIEEAVESLGWSVMFGTQEGRDGKLEKYVTVSGHSDAGEDLEFTEFYNSLDEIPKKYVGRYQDFDVDEHVAMWLEGKQNGTRGVPNARILVEDAERIEQFLLKLSESLRDALAGRKTHTGSERSESRLLPKLLDLIDLRDRIHHGVYEAWDTINALVNNIYGIEIGDALNLWEEQKGA